MAKKAPTKVIQPVREAVYRLDWEVLDEERPTQDFDGLTPEDRAALGLTPTAPASPGHERREDAGRVLRGLLSP